MKLIVCLDIDKGMNFNNRRQSRDIEVINDILNIIGNDKLFIEEYSTKLFPKNRVNIVKSLNENSNINNDDYIFLEREVPDTFKDKIEEVVVYNWNRKYPAEQFFNINLNDNWKLKLTYDIVGNSHEKITIEIYEKTEKRKT